MMPITGGGGFFEFPEWNVKEIKESGRRYLPYAFTEQGVAMLSGILNSETVIQADITIVRAFGQLRQLLASHADLACKLDDLEKKYDAQFKIVFDAFAS